MRKIISILLALILCLLSACDNSRSDDKTTKNPSRPSNPYATEPTVQTEPYQEIKDKLVGTWQHWAANEIISFVDYEHCVWVFGSHGTTYTGVESYTVELIESTYKIVDDNTLIMTPLTPGYTPGEYTFSIVDDELTIFVNGYEDLSTHILQRVPDTNRTNCTIVGTWESFGRNDPLYYDFNGFRRIDNLTFYADGSYVFDGEKPKKGFYSVVHDGNSLYLDERYYWTITIPCPQVMIIQFNDVVSQIYLAQ